MAAPRVTYVGIHTRVPGRWVKKQEENSHVSEALLCEDSKHWMPLCISAEKPTRGRIQITTDFIPAKTSSKQRFPGDLDMCVQTRCTETDERVFLMPLLTGAND